jgi:nucleosome binding factor SPN SPT16 subunit
VQEKLVLSKTGKNPRLTDVWIRPNISGRRTAGTLEAHTNGLRFSSVKGGQIDIVFKNIKHAFFQPADHEMIVLIHFHLRDGIMVGKKKTQDVQFYTEVMELSHDLGGNSRKSGFGDADEIEDEQRERELRQKMNDEFQKFVRKVEEAAGGALEFDIPYRELGFHGVPHRSSVFMQPTVNCLVHLTEAPFFVLSLSDVEIAHFERVQFSLRNFDLVFIMKDLTVVHINTIPMDSLETIKEWLDSCNIKFYQGTQNLAWPRIIQHIKDDPETFYKEGGFEFLNTDDSSGEEEESEEDDQEFAVPSSGSDASGSDDSEEDDSDFSAVSDEDEYEGEEEEDDDAPSWEGLEREAREADKSRGEFDQNPAKKSSVKRKAEYSDPEDDDDDDSEERPKKKAPVRLRSYWSALAHFLLYVV